MNLAEVEDVALDITADGPDNTITSLAFEFQKRDNGRKKRVSFYSAKHDNNLMKLDEDFKLGQKWQKLLSDCLKF
ncbi:hypothetical protein [Flavobacterium sp. 3HN19-14]|uniref:hypothetical protein n=1 Tax=Flavobacterium sp. 3HN19-14 TaxID=3448133 RepID=UPI003EE22714